MRKVKLDYNKPAKNKVVVVKILQSKGYGDLLKIRDHLRHQKHIKCENITLYKEEMEVLITGSNKKDIEKAIHWHAKGLRNAGHGGYRINFKVEEREITLEEIVKKKLKTEFEEKIKEMKEDRNELEAKWSKNRKGMRHTIDKFSGKIRKQDSKIVSLQKEKTKLDDNMSNIRMKLKTYQIPFYKIGWRRFKQLVS
jgi:hypothetical protein|tara:strand:+ start:1318 stop:1905 length:588 start_codon:yes stop_codon:yes gene_type:complete